MESPSENPARRWLAAARGPEVAASLEAVYEMITDQIAARDPACWGSGRCCNFKAAGHRLYTTGLEAAYTLTRLPSGRDLTSEGLEAAISRGDCPFLALNLCGVHAVKPAACRVYFCDRSAKLWQEELAERAHAMIRALHERHALAYRYDEWRTLLGEFLE